MKHKNLYDRNRDVMAYGEHYAAHIGAMTREALHEKSDIAAELGWRDSEIERLEEKIKELTAQMENRIAELNAQILENEAEISHLKDHASFDGFLL